jgi:hypothetical protein
MSLSRREGQAYRLTTPVLSLSWRVVLLISDMAGTGEFEK